MSNFREMSRFCELARIETPELYFALVESHLSLASYLNEKKRKSFILPETNNVTFDRLIELKPEDVVYHGTSMEAFESIKQSGIVDIEKSEERRIYVTTLQRLAEGYASNRWKNHAVLGIRVRDIPSGIVPPDYRYSGYTCIYYGNMSGIGVVTESIPFKGYMAEKSQLRISES